MQTRNHSDNSVCATLQLYKLLSMQLPFPHTVDQFHIYYYHSDFIPAAAINSEGICSLFSLSDRFFKWLRKLIATTGTVDIIKLMSRLLPSPS